MKEKYMIKVLLFVLAFVSFVVPSRAQSVYSVPVSWVATGTNFNWKIYLSTGAGPVAALGSTNVSVGQITGSATNFTVNAVISGLAINTTNRMYVTAVDKTNGLESLPSNTAITVVNSPPAPITFTISGQVTLTPL